jgi:23S rRNA (cytidine1920-2'-O)/16S rRNA (cytidine1409-2'-O)-methyltransferase
MRIDQFLILKGYFQSRSQAQDFIERGLIKYNGKLVTKPSLQIQDQDVDENNFVIEMPDFIPVGRGYEKLNGALEVFQIDCAGKIACDVGASTGGFSQCLLMRGIKKIYAVDVGESQLDNKIKCDPRVINLEKTNIKDLTGFGEGELMDIIVMDLSFISLRLVIENVLGLMKPTSSDLVVLFKPQFEVGAKNLNKQGIVKNHLIAFNALKNFLNDYSQFSLWDITPSSLAGRGGNQEYFLHFKIQIQSPTKINLKEPPYISKLNKLN